MQGLLSESTVALLTAYAIRVAGALLFLFAAWIVAGWIGRLVRQKLEKANFDLTLTKFFANISRTAIMLIAVLSCLGTFGVESTSFAAVLAAAGFAVGLAMQGTLSNFSAGVMLLVFRPFKAGDVVTVNGQTGKVDEIDLFTTRLDTPDNRRIIVPNSAVFGNTIENITYHPTRRVDVGVGTDYSADLAQTRDILSKLADAVPERLQDRDTQVALTDLGDSSINWQVRVWVNAGDYWPVKEALTRDIKNALDNAGIGIPFPQMDVHFDAAPAQAAAGTAPN